jgi:hypothetical protein
MTKHGLSAAAMAAVLAAVAGPAMAQDAAPGLQLELNTVADVEGGGCRTTFVAFNGLTTPVEASVLEMVIFDTSGTVRPPIVLDFGAMASGKTKVVQFDIPGEACAAISRILVNSVSQCTAPGGAPAAGCAETLAVSSRVPAIQFGL